jgi:hypothetical protein
MKTLLTILLISYTTFSFSQSDFFRDRDADLEIGVNFNFKLNTVELGLNLLKDYPGQSCGGLIGDAFIISSEIGMKNNEFLYAPQIAYSYNLLLINGTMSLVNYNHLNNHSLYLRPQLGGTIFGLVDLVYGYNILLSNRNQEFQGSILTLRFKLIETVRTVHLFSK